ncbi:MULTISPECIES: helix-turn-helix transcriptional regulator [Cobetia]|uniref:helix-turn-helix transcriptional regulator n=1 Tax=Cobetia TaxID=204286 RepID=UPI0009845162|nr:MULTISPECIES: AraC family transcriptional regulator [Cobetia]
MSQPLGDTADSRATRRAMAPPQQSSAPPSERRGWRMAKYPHCEGQVQELHPWRDAHLTLCDLEVSCAYHGQHQFHEGLYLCLVLEGRLTLSGVDGVGVDLLAGQGGIFRPARTQSVPPTLKSYHPEGRLRCLSLHLEGEASQSLQVRRGLANWDELPCTRLSRPMGWTPGRWLHQQLDECVRVPGSDGARGECETPVVTACEGEMLEWQGIALQLLGAALKRGAGEVQGVPAFSSSPLPSPSRPHGACRHLEAVRQRLKMAPERQHALPELARLACMSASSLRQKFRETYGCSLSQYQRECRMQRARQALLQGISVQQVAHRVGYAHACNFATAYRRHFGLSPQAVRARPQRAD